jgi:rod shape-determining protein MreD
MMNFIFFFLSTLFLVIIQTVIIPDFPWFPHCFDLMIVNVLYLSLFSTSYGVPFWLVIMGSIMDSLSGAPFFLHSTVYLCIYLIVFFLRRLFFQHSTIFVFLVSLASACIYQGLVMFSIFLLQDQKAIAGTDYRLYIGHLLWTAVGIPLGVSILGALHRNFSHAVKQSRRHLARKYRE